MPSTTRDNMPLNQHTAHGQGADLRLTGWLSAAMPQLTVLTAVGALLLTLAFAIGGWQLNESTAPLLDAGFSWTNHYSWAAALVRIGSVTLDLLGLAIALYAANGIAGRTALIPAFVGGLASVAAHTGYLGGLIAGLIAGLVTRALMRIPASAERRALRDNALIPLAASLITAVLCFYALLGPALAPLKGWFSDKLVQFELTDQHLLLGLLLGLLVCADLGGPLNTVVMGYAIAGINAYSPTPDHLTFMAVVVAAGIVPPLGLSLASLLRGRLFTPAERGYGKIAWLLGLVFIPQAAVPFALRDPLRVIPATLAGGAVTGVLTMHFGSTMAVPRGGFFAADQLGKPLLFATAVAAGTLVTAALAIGLKSLRRTAPATRTVPTVTGKKAVVAGRA
ncbi:fructose-specific PTS transporter subunit EIIC [Streptomyces sp. MA5143a]|uniref:fructose-specific PTS transporter subunit EIIC n=1 Tax=Streptomyces sp. MA5143a TaxID=2083010 RepID=UPI000D1BC6CF|nr:fructose-specific PTS transporter subunit EIIC [Streptomyces sp. MA5143a]SPF07262.1 EIIABC-Fru [Streptomyces sp. MA5143a]